MTTAASTTARGRAELTNAMRSGRGLFIGVAVFSFFVNLLMLTGPLFMLQVYDRVLSSRSFPTLVVLFLLVAGLFLCMGLLDFVRARVLARAGAKFQSLLDVRVFVASMTQSLAPKDRSRPSMGLRDLESIQRVLSGPAPFAIFDAPWTPIYLAAIFLFHPWLGYLALAGGLILFILTLMNEWSSKEPQRKAIEAQAMAETFEQATRREAETIRGLGMRDAATARWRQRRDAALEAQILASDRSGRFTAASKTLRFFLQSAMLALGAWLVIRGEITPGVMIAASILMGRALAPVEQAIGQWGALQRAAQGWRSLSELLSTTPPPAKVMSLPKPKGALAARNLAIGSPGDDRPILRGVTFALNPGEAMGVIGPSGAGKSTLARALVGIWRPMMGEIRIDGATPDQYDSDVLGRAVGYLPQDVALLDATVAENIARLDLEPNAQAVIDAAKRAGAHDMILGLPMGYDTPIGVGGAQLSGGQRQRVALARALYGDPSVVIMDEPNANLDSPGEQALLQAIAELRSRGKTVVIVAHRPSAIASCDKVMMLENGQMRAFGPKDEVLRQTTRNYPQLVKNGAPSGEAGEGGAEDRAAEDRARAQKAMAANAGKPAADGDPGAFSLSGAVGATGVPKPDQAKPASDGG
ncbi:MAG: type I secretion system permease/ATPase [Pseudomonadota bacterium]